MPKIIRRPDFAGGGITKEEEKKLKDHADLWIKRIMRTDAIDPEKIVPAIKHLYAAADLKEPRVIVVPSPLVMAVAGGFASAIWYLRKQRDKGVQISGATDGATSGATSGATYGATDGATSGATYGATDGATYGATDESVNPSNGWALSLAREIAGEDTELYHLMVACVARWSAMYQGGNMWGSYDSYLTGCRDILGLRLPEHEKYASWEECAIEGGYRYMHDEFCLVSDFPEILLKDERHRPHCADGPSHRWRDGWSLFHWHGVRISDDKSWIITNPELITSEKIDQESNQEIKRVMLERFGVQNYVKDGELIDSDVDLVGEPRRLYRKEFRANTWSAPIQLLVLHVKNSTPEPDGIKKDYFLEVHPELRPMLQKNGQIVLGQSQELTCANASASLVGVSGSAYHPLAET